MKKLVLVFNLLIVYSSIIFSQQNFWEATSGPFAGHIISFTINSNGDIFAGAYSGGVYRSTDSGGNWLKLEGLPDYDFQVLKVNSADVLFAGMPGGIFRSTNNGDSWEELSGEIQNNNVWSLVIDTIDYIYAGTASSGVLRSTDNGETWTVINNGLTNLGIPALANNSAGHLFAGTYSGIYKSTDNGNTWNLKNNGITSNIFSQIAIDDSDNVFVGTYDAGMFRSSNNGENWSHLNTLTNISTLSINSNNELLVGSRDD